METHTLFDKVTRAFTSRYHQQPTLVVRAPGRVNLIGEHTDYNDGYVLPVAVDKAAWLAVAPHYEPWATVRALDMGGDEKTFPVDRVPSSSGGWADYPMGVVWAFLERGMQLTGIKSVLTSDVPVGAGMSSSAAVELAFAFSWNELSKLKIDLPNLALLCQLAENKYVGVNCGIMDQMISACGKAGHAMMLDSRSLERKYFSMPDGVAILVADSMVRRSLSTSEYNTRRAQCEQAVNILAQDLPNVKALRDVSIDELMQYQHQMPDVVYRRARHVVTENDRVLKLSRKLAAGEMNEVGEILVHGHNSLRDDYEVSIAELDTLVAAAVEVEGCFGARLTGAGFGGCIIALVADDAVSEVEDHITSVYTEKYSESPAVYVTRPADGVSKKEI
jgi:galactokinase